ncbi:MAG TPA: ABC transporter permease [Candidatus Bathyarchaeia archaeon]|nr:ABC transporter permease [Candidatus Bathyarchaeia archaeon]
MKQIILKRLSMLVLVLVGVTMLTFFLSHVIPGDPARMMVGQRATEETLQEVRRQLGLDQPVWVQYFTYIQGLFAGDLGTSIRTQQPVSDDLLTFFPATLELALLAFVIAILFGVPIGILSAVKKDTMWDHAGRLFSIAGVSTPVFWSGLIGILIFYKFLGWLPSSGRLDLSVTPPLKLTGLYLLDSLLTLNWAAFKNSLLHLLLPAFTLAFAQLAIVTRQVRASMLEVLGQEYIRTALANGISGPVLLFRYALRNALIPTITVVGLSFGSLLGGAVVTETIFSWPGMGKYVVDSIAFLDFPAIMGFTFVISIGYVLINLLVDLTYYALNPEMKE